MKSNTFYLRDGYSVEEMIDRIPAAKINHSVEGFEQALQEFGLDSSSYGTMSKSVFFERISKELDEEYENLVHLLFDNCGQDGDKFNLQPFSLPPEADYSNIHSSAQEIQGERIDESVDDAKNVLILTDVESRDDSAAVDLGFRTAEKIEEVQPDEDIPVIIRRADTGEIEAEYEEGYIVEAPTRRKIEARIYMNERIIAISKGGGIVDSQHTDILRFVNSLADSTGETQ